MTYLQSPNLPAWMLDFKRTHGFFPVAGGSDDDGPPTPPAGDTIVIEEPPADPDPAPSTVEPGDRFTAEDLERVRKEEKEKVFGRLNKVQEEVERLRKERDEEQRLREEAEAAAAKEAEEEAEAARRKAEEEMEVRDLLQTKEQEWEERFRKQQELLEQQAAIAEREASLAKIEDYRNQRIREKEDALMPQLLDLITGETPEEIDASIAMVADKTASILAEARQAQTTSRQQMQGTLPTGSPPIGPVEETDSAQKTLTAAEIRKMSNADYAKHRAQLRDAAAQQVRQHGLYGRR